MVSIFEGQLTRTWVYQLNPPHSRKHTINLFHDTITGVRSAMLDFEEIPDSIGNSSFFMSSQGHKIPFTITDVVMIPNGIKHSNTIESNAINETDYTGVKTHDPLSSSSSSSIISTTTDTSIKTIKTITGYIEIKKNGWTEFAYSCVIDNVILKELTHTLSPTQGQIIYKITIDETLLTKSDVNEEFVCWYYVESSRIVDTRASTRVHRLVDE